jgi:hypothetical protein
LSAGLRLTRGHGSLILELNDTRESASIVILKERALCATEGPLQSQLLAELPQGVLYRSWNVSSGPGFHARHPLGSIRF